MKNEIIWRMSEEELINTIKHLLVMPETFTHCTSFSKLTIKIKGQRRRVLQEIHNYIERRLGNIQEVERNHDQKP